MSQQSAAPKESLLQNLMPVIVLTIICAVSGATLAGVKLGTAQRIEEQVLSNVQGPTLLRMFPQAENDLIAERKKLVRADGREVTVFPVREKNRLSAVAIEGFGPGYGGDLGVMVGFNLEAGTIRSIGITSSKETPGIGSRVAEPQFARQFAGKAPSVALSSNGGDIDALSGATISSGASVTAVEEAGRAFTELKEEILKAWPQGS